MKNTFKKLFLFNYTECDALREYLEEMALNGWMLKDINTFLIFEKMVPRKLIYSVEIFEKASTYDTRLGNQAMEYVDLCEEAGWHFVCSTGKIHIFVTDDGNTIPIETDQALKYQTIKNSTIRKDIIQWFILPLLFIFNIGIQYFTNFNLFITSDVWLLSPCILALYFVIITGQIIFFCAWCNRSKRNLAEGKKLPSYNQKDLKRRSKLRIFPIIFLLILIAITGIVEISKHEYFTGFLILTCIMIIIAIFILNILFTKMKLSRSANVIFPVITGFIFAFVVICFSIIGTTFSQDNLKIIVDKNSVSFCGYSKIPLTLEDIGIKPNDKYRDTNKNRNESFLATYTSYYDNAKIESKEIGISYSIFESKYDFIINQYVKYNTTSFGRTYKQTDASKWDAKAVYIPSEKSFGSTVVIYNHLVFTINCDVKLNDNIINTIKQKLDLKNLSSSAK